MKKPTYEMNRYQKMNGYLKGGIVTLFILSFLGVSSWCLFKVSEVPAKYATKSEVKEVKIDIKDQLSEMRKGFNTRQDKLDKKMDKLRDLFIDDIMRKEN